MAPPVIWTYLDNYVVGACGNRAHRLGGPSGPAVAPTKLLQTYRAGRD